MRPRKECADVSHTTTSGCSHDDDLLNPIPRFLICLLTPGTTEIPVLRVF